jgi:CRP-like cAMP-binding protein
MKAVAWLKVIWCMARMSLAEIAKAGGAVARKYAAREEIFTFGADSSEGVCLVLQGVVEAFQANADQTTRPINQYGPGAFFGLSATLGIPRFETARAGNAEVKVLFLNEADFLRYLRENPAFLSEMFKLTLQRLRSIPEHLIQKPDTEMRIEEIFGPGAGERFAAIRRQNLVVLEYLNKMRNKYVSPGKKLFDNDNVTDTDVYLLVEGNIEQYWKDGSLVITLEPGAMFGFLKAADDDGHVLTAVAGKSTAKLIALDDDILTKLSHLDQRLAYSIFQNMVLTIALVESQMIRKSVI